MHRAALAGVARLNSHERLLGIGGAVLLVSLFFTWFRESFAVGDLPLGEVSASGWAALPVIRWVLLGTALTAIGVPFAVALGASLRLTVPPSVFVTLAGGASYGLVLWRLVAPPGTYTQRELAAFIALFSAAVIAYAGYRLMESAGVTFRGAADALAGTGRSERDRTRSRSAPPPPPKRRDRES